MNDLINQQRERIANLERLKRESDSVLSPVLDYCRDNGIGEIGKSMTQALAKEHAKQRDEIEVLKVKLSAFEAIKAEMVELIRQAQSAEQRVKELEKFKLAVMQSMHHYDHELIGETGLIDNVSEFLGDDFSALNKFAIEQQIKGVSDSIDLYEKFDKAGEPLGVISVLLTRLGQLEQLRAKGGE